MVTNTSPETAPAVGRQSTRESARGRTLVFMPAFNEEDTVGQVVRNVLAELPDVDVLVVDDGSSDATAHAARAAGARVASLPFNQGLGAALHTGYLVALREGYDYCAHLDADGQHPVSELKRLLSNVWERRCDLALGSRYHPESETPVGAYQPTFARRVGISIFRRLLALTCGTRFTDTTSGLRAANRRAISLFAHRYQPDFGELESLQRSVREGLEIAEIPVRCCRARRAHRRSRRGGSYSRVSSWCSSERCGGRRTGHGRDRAATQPAVHLTVQTRVLAALLGLAFTLAILELIRRHRLQER